MLQIIQPGYEFNWKMRHLSLVGAIASSSALWPIHHPPLGSLPHHLILDQTFIRKAGSSRKKYFLHDISCVKVLFSSLPVAILWQNYNVWWNLYYGNPWLQSGGPLNSAKKVIMTVSNLIWIQSTQWHQRVKVWPLQTLPIPTTTAAIQ